jgi:RNA polymerase sigma-70 factor, ECF subfamily
VSPEQFSQIFRQYLPVISKYLVRRVPVSDVEELASSIFEIAWAKKNQAPAGHELAWLYKIAGFVVANYRRKEAKKDKFLLTFRPDSSPSVEDIALGDLALAQAWRTLSPAARQAIALASFDGLDNDQAARVLGISSNAFALRLSKARKKLKEQLLIDLKT